MDKTCQKCNHVFSTKNHYQKHLLRKTPCDKEVIKKFKCKNCDITFTCANSMYRHMRESCIVAKIIKTKKNNKILELTPIEQALQLQILALNNKLDSLTIPQNNAILQTIPVIQLPVQQPIIQPVLQTQKIETQNNIETQQNIENQQNININNVNIVQYNLPYADTEDVLKTILTKGSADG